MFDRSQLFALAIAPLAVAAVVATAGPAAADGLGDLTPIEDSGYLVDDAHYKGTVFFRTPDGRNCGFYSNGPAGCDAVPMDAPPGTNQVRSSTTETAHYLTAEATFTYPGGAKVLPEGHRVTLGGTTCGIGYQGTVTCETGPHGFTIAATYGVLH